MCYNIAYFAQNLSDEFGITDEVFEEYNRETTEAGQKIIPARLFMFAIGQEVGDLHPAKHLACDNKGIKRQ